MVNKVRTEVIVVGGGPVGMLVAAELGLYGVKTVVVEIEAAVVDQPKAGTLHARAVQGLARRGYLAAPGQGFEGEAAQPFHFAGMPGLKIGAPRGEPKSVLKIPQAELERLIEKRALECGATVLRSHRVTGVVQHADRVAVLAEGPEGTVELTADYLVGADGSRSTVRQQIGFTAEVHPATVSALMGRVRFTDRGSVPPGWTRTARGWVVCTMSADGEGLVRTARFDGPCQDRRALVTLSELSSEVAFILGRDVPLVEPSSLSRFSDFTRLVHRFSDGRVFLAGDAAHVQFPVGGQGLSTGLQDAFNLGWKIAYVVRGIMGEHLLSTYHDERWPAARSVVDNTRAQLALMRPGRELDPLRELFASLLSLEGVNEYIGSLISAQETVYPAPSSAASPWVGRFFPNQRIETPQGTVDIAEMQHDGRAVLLLSSGAGTRYEAEARGRENALRVVRANGETALPHDALLIRPDGYVAWTADAESPVQSLRTWFGDPD